MLYVFCATRTGVTGSLPPVVAWCSYTFIICLSFFIMTGSVGFYASFLFVRKIYSSVKIE